MKNSLGSSKIHAKITHQTTNLDNTLDIAI